MHTIAEASVSRAIDLAFMTPPRCVSLGIRRWIRREDKRKSLAVGWGAPPHPQRSIVYLRAAMSAGPQKLHGGHGGTRGELDRDPLAVRDPSN
jgi:hypothetical protein